MEPIKIIFDALVGGAVVAGKDIVVQGVKDGYEALKNLVVRRFKSKADIENALQYLEKKPESESRRGVLREELEVAGVDKDADLVKRSQEFLNMMKEKGLFGTSAYNALLIGNGGLAQGTKSTAAGAGGIAIGGNVEGGIVTRGEGTNTTNKNEADP